MQITSHLKVHSSRTPGRVPRLLAKLIVNDNPMRYVKFQHFKRCGFMSTSTSEVTKIVGHITSVIAREAEINHAAATLSLATLEVLCSSVILSAKVPAEHGGWGLGVHNGRPLEYWQIIRRIAQADTSIGQSCQVHWMFSCMCAMKITSV